MKVTGTIYTTNRKRWVKALLPSIYKVILRAKGVTVEDFEIIEIELPDVVPTYFDRLFGGTFIEWDWLRANYKTEGNILCLHISPKERDRIGLKHPTAKNLGGVYDRNIGDTTLDFVVIADSKSEFDRVFLHELSHGFAHWSGVADQTHHYDYDLHDIQSIYDTFDFIKWNKLKDTADQLAVEYNTLKNLSYRDILLQKVEKLTKIVNDLFRTNNYEGLLPLVQRRAEVVVAEMKRLGHEVSIVEGYRSADRQNELYNQGRTTPGAVVTNAKAGESLHNYGVAVDLVFKEEGYNASDTLWALLGEVGKKQGFDWGGDWEGFVDRPHLQLTQSYSLADFQKGGVDYSKFS